MRRFFCIVGQRITRLLAGSRAECRVVQRRIGTPVVAGNVVTCEANYQVFETLIDEPTKILQVGKYHDKLVLDGDRVLIRERECVFDTVVVPNCVVYPV